jgi:hypothetical protein
MPKVTEYGTPQVRQQPLRTPLQQFDSRGAFGESLAAGLSDVAATLERVREEDDRTLVKEKLAEYRAFSSQRSYQDEDAYYRRQGKAAYDSLEGNKKELADFRRELGKDLTPQQLRMFNLVSQDYIDRDYEGLAKHAFKGREQWQNETDVNGIELAKQELALNWTDAGTYVKQIKKINSDMAKRNGWPDEKREVNEIAALTAAHRTAIENIVKQSPTAANAYYEQHKDDIHPDQRDEIVELLETGTRTNWVMTAADQIAASGASLTRQLEMARTAAGDDGVARKALRTELEHRDAVRWQQSQRFRSEAAYHAVTMIGTGPGDISATEYASQYPDQWNALTTDVQNALSGDGLPKQSDLGTYYRLTGLISRGETGKATEYLSENVGKLSHTDAKSFIDDLFKPGTTTGGYKLVEGDTAAFNRMAERILGKRPNDVSDRQEWDTRRDVMLGMFQGSLNTWHANHPNMKQIPFEDRETLLHRFTVEATKEVDWWPDKQVGIDDIPIDELEAIRARLKREGYDHNNPVNIIKLYTAAQ